MKEKLQESLYKKYPTLFSRRNLATSDTCMCYGITCDSGWYKLIDDCCYSIMNYCTKNNCKIPKFDQIKEKFGCLRIYFYTNDSPECYKDLTEIVNIFEGLSSNICEICGDAGKVGTHERTRARGYILTLCESCRGENK